MQINDRLFVDLLPDTWKGPQPPLPTEVIEELARRAREAEQMLAGARAEVSVFRRAAEAALASAKPSGDNAFKIELARRILARALMLAAAGTPKRLPALPASPFAAVSGAALHA